MMQNSTLKSKSFILADDAVIFDGQTEGNDAYQVLKVTQLDTDDDITAKVIFNDNGEIEVLLVTAGVEVEQGGTYAVINDIEVGLNGDGKSVYVVTAYVDGERVSFLTNRSYYSANPNASDLRTALRGGYQLAQLTMEGDVITGITTESAIEGKVKTVKAANDVFTIIKEAGNAKQTIVLADDAIVYVQTGAATVEVTDLYDLDADDVDVYANAQGDTVKVYDTDGDDEYDIVIIKRR